MKRVTLSLLAIVITLGVGGYSLRADAPPRLALQPIRPSVQPRSSAAKIIPGLVVAAREARLAIEAEGVVVERPKDEHQAVKKGELILAIDSRELILELEIAKARVLDTEARRKLAKNELDRARGLSQRDVSSRAELDRTTAEMERAQAAGIIARAEARRAEIRLEKSRVIAPFSGQLVRVLPEVGEYLRPGDEVAILVATDRLELESWLSASDLEGLRAGMKISLKSSSGAKATLRSIAPAAGNSARSFQVILDLEPSEKLKLRPGMSVDWIHPKPEAESR